MNRNVVVLFCFFMGCAGRPADPCTTAMQKEEDSHPSKSQLTQQAPPDPTSYSTSPNEPPMEEEETTTDPPLDFVMANMSQTHVTAYVKISAVTIDDPHPEQMYVNHVYHAAVQKVIAGNPPSTIVYAVMAERNIPPHSVGTFQLVSLCRNNIGTFYSPDTGYTFSISTELLNELQSHPFSAKEQTASACE